MPQNPAIPNTKGSLGRPPEAACFLRGVDVPLGRPGADRITIRVPIAWLEGFYKGCYKSLGDRVRMSVSALCSMASSGSSIHFSLGCARRVS